MPLGVLGFLLCVHWKRQKAKRDQQVVPLNRSPLSNSRRTTGDIRTSSGVSALLAIAKGKTIYHAGRLPTVLTSQAWLSPSFSMTVAPGCCPCTQHWCPAKGSSPAPGKRGCQCAFCGKDCSVRRGQPTPGERARRPGIAVGMTVLERSQPTTV